MSKEEEQKAEVQRILKCKKDDSFAILKLDIATCAFEDVARAYKKVALYVHPDKCPNIPQAKDAFAVADAAYKNLDESKFNRFKAAFERKNKAAAAARTVASNAAGAAAVGGSVFDTVEDEKELARQREHDYLAALREHKSREEKRHRSETEKRAANATTAEIDAQLKQVDELRAMYGSTVAGKVSRKGGAGPLPQR